MKSTLIYFLAIIILHEPAIGQASLPLWKTLPDIPAMPKSDESGFAQVNDIQMFYAIFNKDGKEPVILLHGGFSSSNDWAFEVPLLSKTHKVIVADSRGHGRSSMSNQVLSYALMASDVIQLLDYLKIKKVSIVGWSDGGIIGLILAIKSPERVNKLFTYGTNYTISGYKNEPFDSSLSARFIERAEANYRRLSPTPNGFEKLKVSLGKMYSIEPDLQAEDIRSIKTPTVIGCGQYEQFIKREHFEELVQLIPNSKLVILPNVSHGGPIQDPAGFHKAVINLIDRN